MEHKNNNIHVINNQRRDILKTALASGIAYGLYGCSHYDKKESIPNLPESQIVIDTHCHVFNAADLPVEGFVRHVVLGDLEMLGAATLAGIIIQAISDAFAPGYDEEKARLEAKLGDNDQLTTSLVSTWKIEDDNRDKTYKDIVNKSINEINRRVENNLFLSSDELDFIKEVRKEAGVGETQLLGVIDWYEKLTTAVDAYNVLVTIGRYLLWGIKMVRYRYKQINDIRSTYSQVKLFTPALVDFDHWLYPENENSSRVSIEEQMDLYVLLNRLYKGSVHPFVAFDPLRDVETDGETLNKLKDIIANKGAIGVKIYPPMGFRVYENDGEEFCDSNISNLGNKLDQSLWNLYEYCEINEVPILAHTANTNTNGRCENYKNRANPIYWKIVLDNFNNLRINLGHFATHDLPGNDWSLTIRELMIKYPNVYADLSHIEDLSYDAYDKKFFNALQDFISGVDKPDQLKIQARLLYGSDWIMLAKEKISKNYFRHMLNQFDAYFTLEIRNQFIGENAVNYLGLKSGKNRTRLDDFYKSHSIETPDWLKSLSNP